MAGQNPATTFDSKALTTTFGSLLLGTFVSSILYGYTCFLGFRYYRQYPNDSSWFKWLVATLWFLDTLHTVLSMHFSYHYLVIHYFDPQSMNTVVWSLQLSILVSTFPPLLSNSFYLSRLYKIGQRNIFLIGGIAALILGRLGLEFAASVESFLHPKFADHAHFSFLVKAFCTVSSAADILLAALITWHLHKRRTGFQRSDTTIDVLIVYTLSTGFLTSVVCLLSMISIFVITNGMVDLALHALLGKLYVTSVLAVLNSRKAHDKAHGVLYEISAFGVDSASEKRALLGSRAMPGMSIGAASTFLSEDAMHANERHIEEGRTVRIRPSLDLPVEGRPSLHVPRERSNLRE